MNLAGNALTAVFGLIIVGLVLANSESMNIVMHAFGRTNLTAIESLTAGGGKVGK